MLDIRKDKTIPGGSRNEEKRKAGKKSKYLHTFGVSIALQHTVSCIFYCIKDKQQVIWLKECLPQTKERRIWIEEPTNISLVFQKWILRQNSYKVCGAYKLVKSICVFHVCTAQSYQSGTNSLSSHHSCTPQNAFEHSYARTQHIYIYKYTRITNIYVHTFE